LPDTGNIPLVGDISSNIMSEVMDVSKYGVLFAGAQKNVGPAGVTIAIVRDDLIGNAMDICPTMLDYKIHSKNKSLYNTPPCFSIYVSKLVFEWIKENGGVKGIQQMNEEKAAVLYDFLDESKMFRGTVVKEDRSLMNIPFVTDNDELNAKFIKEADEVLRKEDSQEGF
jgi:phosphoserine aminotransferase